VKLIGKQHLFFQTKGKWSIGRLSFVSYLARR
jgi:hypothetical protein